MSRWVALGGAVVLAGLLIAAPASAGTYGWSMPSDFTVAPPGSNPDHDSYGGTPWSYIVYDGANPASLSFSTSIAGGLSGWSDGGNAFVAENATRAAIGGVAPGQLAIRPPQHGTSEVTWTSPLSATVSVSGSVTQPSPGLPTCRFVWALSNGASILANGASDGNGSVSATAAVSPGSVLVLYVQDASVSVSYSPSCVTAVLSLTISAPSAAPAVSLTSPSPGATVNGQPTFAGAAAAGFGVARSVSVHVYSGSGTGGNPVETVAAPVSAGSYAASTNPPLPSGTYTAQAEQDDLAGDRGFSATATFTVRNVPPTVTLKAVTRVFTTSTPTLTGNAGTSSEDQPQVYLGLYAGPVASGRLVRLVSGTRAANGSFAITITPGLPDGFYTAVAGQGGLGGNGFSAPLVIQVKVHPPALTFDQPGNDTAINPGRPVFSGTLGVVAGVYPEVKLSLYSGPLVIGKPTKTVVIKTKGSTWSYSWPGNMPLGFHTAVVEAADNAGHTVTIQHAFVVTVLPQVIGYVLTLNKQGRISISITCPAEAGSCVGDVLALTTKRLQPVRGGPTGYVRLMFVHVRIAAGQTATVTRALTRPVVSVLRERSPMQVQVGAILTPTHGRTIRVFKDRLLNFS